MDLDAPMRRRTWLFAVFVIVVVGGVLMASVQRSPFRAWPRYVSAPDSVPRGALTRVLVLDDRGQPARGAEVHFSTLAGHADLVSTDARGAAAIPTPENTVLFATRGALASRLAWLGPEVPKDGVVLPLGLAGSLDVSVLEGALPVPEAQIHLRGDFELLEGTTDATGKWTVAALPAGVATLFVDARGRRSFTHVAILPGRRVSAVVPIVSTCELKGHVRVRGAPWPDAGVALRGLVDGERIFERRTDEGGAFSFTVRDTASFVLRAEVEGMVTSDEPIPPGCAPHEVSLRPGIPLELEVVDSGGRALPSAGVRLRPGSWTGDVWHHELVTDTVGRARSQALSAEPWIVEATFGDSTFVERVAQPADAGRVVMRAPFATRRVEGRVVDAVSGSPIPGANVAGETTTAADGTFSYLAVASDPLRVAVGAAGYLTRGLDSKNDGQQLLFRLERRDWTTGRIVDREGRPIPEFQLGAENFFTADGRFVLSSRESRVTVRAWGFAPRELELDEHQLGDVALDALTPLEVRAFLPDGGAIAADLMHPTAEGDTAISLLRRQQVLRLGSTDETGRGFVFPQGACVFAASFPLVPSDCIEPDGGVLQLRLDEPARLEGLVLARDGGLVSGARIELDEAEAATFSDAEGRYRLYPITPGTRTVSVNLASGVARQQRVTLAPGETAQLNFDEHGGGRLSVRARGAEPARQVQIVVRGDGILTVETLISDARGEASLELSGLGSGVHTITISQGERRAESTSYVTETPHAVTLDLRAQ